PHAAPVIKGHVTQIGTDLRLRTQLYMSGVQVERFAVSLEVSLESHGMGWVRVACCDSWGGTTHIDTYRPDGSDLRHHKNAFHSEDIHVSVKWARDYMMGHAHRLVSDFRRLL